MDEDIEGQDGEQAAAGADEVAPEEQAQPASPSQEAPQGTVEEAGDEETESLAETLEMADDVHVDTIAEEAVAQPIGEQTEALSEPAEDTSEMAEDFSVDTEEIGISDEIADETSGALAEPLAEGYEAAGVEDEFDFAEAETWGEPSTEDFEYVPELPYEEDMEPADMADFLEPGEADTYAGDLTWEAGGFAPMPMAPQFGFHEGFRFGCGFTVATCLVLLIIPLILSIFALAFLALN